MATTTPDVPSAQIGFLSFGYLSLQANGEHIVHELDQIDGVDLGKPLAKKLAKGDLFALVALIFPDQAPYFESIEDTKKKVSRIVDISKVPDKKGVKSPPPGFTVLRLRDGKGFSSLALVARSWPEAIIAVPHQDSLTSQRAFRANVAHFFTAMQCLKRSKADKVKAVVGRAGPGLLDVFKELQTRLPTPDFFQTMDTIAKLQAPSILEPTYTVNLFYGGKFFMDLFGSAAVLRIIEEFVFRKRKIFLVGPRKLEAALSLLATWILHHVIGEEFCATSMAWPTPWLVTSDMRLNMMMQNPSAALMAMSDETFQLASSLPSMQHEFERLGNEDPGHLSRFTFNSKGGLVAHEEWVVVEDKKTGQQGLDWAPSDKMFAKPIFLAPLETAITKWREGAGKPTMTLKKKKVLKLPTFSKKKKAAKKAALYAYTSGMEEIINEYLLRLVWAFFRPAGEVVSKTVLEKKFPTAAAVVSQFRDPKQRSHLEKAGFATNFSIRACMNALFLEMASKTREVGGPVEPGKGVKDATSDGTLGGSGNEGSPAELYEDVLEGSDPWDALESASPITKGRVAALIKQFDDVAPQREEKADAVLDLSETEFAVPSNATGTGKPVRPPSRPNDTAVEKPKRPSTRPSALKDKEADPPKKTSDMKGGPSKSFDITATEEELNELLAITVLRRAKPVQYKKEEIKQEYSLRGIEDTTLRDLDPGESYFTSLISGEEERGSPYIESALRRVVPVDSLESALKVVERSSPKLLAMNRDQLRSSASDVSNKDFDDLPIGLRNRLKSSLLIDVEPEL